MRIDRRFKALPFCLTIIFILFANVSNAYQELNFRPSSSKDIIIWLDAKNIRKEGDKSKADVVLVNNKGTWVYVKQDFSEGKFPVPTEGAYLIGPNYIKNLGTKEFTKGSFIKFNAETAIGVGYRLGSPESNMLLGALAIDLAMRGFFSKELPPNAFDRPLMLPIEVGMASIDPLFYTITSHCSGPLGVFSKAVIMKDADKAIEALGKFLICTTEAPVREKIKEWLIKLFSKEVAEKWARIFVGNIGDFVNVPLKATLIELITKNTFAAPPEGWARIEAVEVAAPVANPQIISISPTQVQAGRFTLTINGSNFDSGAIDQFYTPSGQYMGSGIQSGGLVSRTSNQLVVRETLTGVSADTYTIRVKNGDGKMSSPVNIQIVGPSPPLPEVPASIPVLQGPLRGNISDRRVLLGFGRDWTWESCSGLYKKHTGVDLSASVGEDVFASESGTVKTIFVASATNNWGQGITIQHNGFTTLYLHVLPTVLIGQSVTKGQKIATIASIPNYHLHYGVREGTYSNIANRGALPQKNSSENQSCQNDPLFPESFINPMSLRYDASVVPPPSPQPSTCEDGAQFVADLTVPDVAQMRPGQGFTKTWKMRNTGSCSWGSGYSLVFVSGVQMGAPSSVSVPSVSPNAVAEISLPMVAPTTYGVYQGYWRMRNSKGQPFGSQIWVKVQVAKVAVVEPKITSISPSQVQAGQFTITINGNNFDSGAIDQLYTSSGQLIGSGVQSGGLISRSSNQVFVRENLTGAQPGTYSIRIKNSDGKVSNPVNISITGAPVSVSPSVSMTPSSGPVGTTFIQTGRGFSPNSIATLHGRRPDGSVWQINTVRTDSSGVFSLTSTAKTPGNNFAWWAVDNATGKKSNEVIYNVMLSTPQLVEGSLIRLRGQPQVYVIQGGKKCYITDQETFNTKGYRWDQIKDVDEVTFISIPMGGPLTSIKGTTTPTKEPTLPIQVTTAQRCPLGKEYTKRPHPKNAFEQSGLRGYCTWYVAECWLWDGNPGLPSIRNAAEWIGDAKNKNFHIDSKSPVKGSIIVFGPSSKNPAGHIAYIERVDEKSGIYVISQMNFGANFDPNTYKTDCFNKITGDEIKIGATHYGGMQILGFIYPVTASIPQIPSTSINARIDNYGASPTKIQVGQTSTFKVAFTNTGNTPWTFGAGISLRRPDGARIDSLPTQTVKLNPNQQGIATWTYTIDREGPWDVVFGIWKDPAGKDLLTQTGWLSRFVIAEARSPSPVPKPTPQVPAPPTPTIPDPQLLAQVQQSRALWERLNTQASQISYPTTADRAAVNQELQRAGQALQSAEAAAQRGDRATVQHQLEQAQQALNTVSQRLAQIAQWTAPPKPAPTNLPPQAKITLRSGTSTTYENQILQLMIPQGGTAQVMLSGERSTDSERSQLTYQWFINGQSVNTARDFSFSLRRGTHQILLKVRDSQGLENVVGATVNVTEQVAAPPPPTPPVQPPVAVKPPSPHPAPTPACTDGAQFVTDVTVPDGTRVQSGQSFTKTWRLKNTGTCAWGSSYSLVFISGSQMGAPISVSVLNTPVNGTADISVPMVAPSSSGTYQGYWQMRNPQGKTFGTQIWVKITVASVSPPPSPTPAPVPSPQIASISPIQVQAGQFTLIISGSNFDSGAIDQFYTPSSQYIGSGAQSGGLISRTSTQIVVRENFTSAQAGTYVVRVKNSDGKLSNLVNIVVTATPSPPPPSVITPAPSPQPQPPVTPQPITARIDIVDVVPKGVQVGQSVTLRMRFTNTGNTTHTFIAGASLWRPDGNLNPDIDFERAVILTPGQATEVSWSHQVDRPGNWGYQFAVWKQKPFIPSNLLVKQPSPISFFSVTAAVTQPPPPLPKSPTPQAPPAPSPTACVDGIQLVGDVTVPDNTQLKPQEAFIKTWRLRNTGSCSWGSGYSLVFVSGSQMGASSSVSVPSTPPNGLGDISVAMVAPSAPGIHQGYWQMRNLKGQPFGPQIWVKINVVPAPSTLPPTSIPTPTKTVPQSISARIDDFTPKDPNKPVSVPVGGSVTLSVKFTNTGNTAWRFIVGASVWDSKGKVVGDYSTTLSAPLQLGQQTSVSWSHPIREAGDYWVQFGVWKAAPFVGENLLEKKPAPAQKLIMGIKK